MGVCTHPGSSHWTHGTHAFFACLSRLRKAAESKEQGVPPAPAIDCKDPGSPGGPPSLLHLLLALKIPRYPFWITALRTTLHCASCLGDRSRFRRGIIKVVWTHSFPRSFPRIYREPATGLPLPMLQLTDPSSLPI